MYDVNNWDTSTQQRAVFEAKTIMRGMGSNYYVASLLYPRHIREDIYVLYAFVRISDELVDGQGEDTDKIQAIEAQLIEWNKAFETNQSDDLIIAATVKLWKQKNMPSAWMVDFLTAMKSDMVNQRYQTYAHLRDYMWGSAMVVGHMVSKIIGYQDSRTTQYAADLGEAMQLSNFLRDIKEDVVDRQRIYLPLDELQQFKISPEEITQMSAGEVPVSEQFIKFMKFQINRADKLYANAEKGISLLNKDGRKAVWAGLIIYREILREIEKNKYDVFSKRCNPSYARKVWLLIKVLFKNV